MTMTRRSPAVMDEPAVTVSGDAAAEVAGAARRKLVGLARYTGEPMTHARVRLTRLPDPRVARPILAQGNVVVGGRTVRAQVTAHTPREALHLIHDRLQTRLLRVSRHWQARRGGQPAGGRRPAGGGPAWRHGQEPTHRPPYFPRPPEERQVVRHKTYGPSVRTPDEAADDMELLDYDFYLFTDSETGQDAIVYRAGPSGYRLAGLTPPSPSWPPPAVPLTASDQPAPRLGLAEAIDRLNLAGTPFLLFADEATGRGRVLYRRYDGHYGLISPAEQDDERRGWTS
jgi:hypothetical protein